VTLAIGKRTAGGDGVVEAVEDVDDCDVGFEPVLEVELDDDDVEAVVDEIVPAVAAVVAEPAIVEVVASVVLVVELDTVDEMVDEVEVDEEEVDEASASPIAPPATETRSAPSASTAGATVVVAPGLSATTVTAARSATGSWSKPEQALRASTAIDTAVAAPHRRLHLLVRITRRLPRLISQR